MNWIPSKDEQKYLELVASMSIDCIMGRGTSDRKAYVNNLRTAAELLDKVKTDVQLDIYYGDLNYKRYMESLAITNPEMHGKMESWYNDLIKRITSDERVIVHGRVSETELLKEFGSHHAWVYPTYFHETFCLTGTYAQAADLLITTNELAALKETVGGRADFMIEGDVADLVVQKKYAEAIDEFGDIQRYKDVNGVINNARINWVKNHYWSQIAKRWDYLIRSL